MTNQQEVVADALLPCPWCGCAMDDPLVTEGSTFRWRKVSGCCADGPEVRHDTMAEDQAAAELESRAAAIAAWNTRPLATLPTQSAGVEERKKEVMLRWLLARTYSGANLYCDDGEMSDSSAHPAIDFLRDDWEVIESKMQERAAALRTKQPAASEGDGLARIHAMFRMLGLDRIEELPG